MKTNTLKLLFATALVHTMCFTVVLSHLHAKDAMSLMSQHSNMTKLAAGDITAKALGDLHHHIDKASMKNIAINNGSTTAARVRGLSTITIETDDDTISTRLHEFFLRLQVVGSLCLQRAI